MPPQFFAMNKLTIALIVISGNLQCSGQGINNIWITGYDNGSGAGFGNSFFNFSFQPVAISQQNCSLNFDRTCATISDSAGNLLFYTNGFAVFNALFDTMPNGRGLDSSSVLNNFYFGSPLAQGALILPASNNNSAYYLFHESVEVTSWPGILTYAPRDLFYSLIDMTADSGRGDIIIKEQTIFTLPVFPPAP